MDIDMQKGGDTRLLANLELRFFTSKKMGLFSKGDF
jgi:hypothetical protein